MLVDMLGEIRERLQPKGYQAVCRTRGCGWKGKPFPVYGTATINAKSFAQVELSNHVEATRVAIISDVGGADSAGYESHDVKISTLR